MKTKTFEFFHHTADAMFRAYGKTLEEAFSNAGKAVFSLMFDNIQDCDLVKISVEGKDRKALLYNFIEELLYLLDTEGFVFNNVREMSMRSGKIMATLCGEKISEDRPGHGEVKAITYNSMEIGKENDKYYVQVVVDM